MDKIIEKALGELNDYLQQTPWYGREGETVNLFVHAFLTKHLGQEGFTSLSQIGIEVSVKQLAAAKRKKLVRKDLVIWEKEKQTVWDKKRAPVNDPLAILEWKVNSLFLCQGDIEWLKQYTKIYPKVTGYSVCAFLKDQRGVSYRKIKNGEIVV